MQVQDLESFSALCWPTLALPNGNITGIISVPCHVLVIVIVIIYMWFRAFMACGDRIHCLSRRVRLHTPLGEANRLMYGTR